MSRHDPKVRLLHMRDYAQDAMAMVEGETRADLDTDNKLRLALTRLVELVGEAASCLPEELRAKHPEIPWPEVIGMRNRLIHGYDFVDYDILWNTITRNLPQLIETLDRILDAET
ncbi:MAG: DUF86 domain-containing protein [Candidatus Bipolaricaulota bacterium]|nr:DUF86 domain-containing protein [Candidatus Bipolaricaulota bacterium]